MHLTHLPPSLLLLLLLSPSTLSLPDPRPHQPHQQNSDQILLPNDPSARQRRLEAWNAQKPLHTTALLAGAAATALSKAQLSEGRRRDLSGVTGEKGMWMPVPVCDEEGDGKGGSGRGDGGDVRGEKGIEADFEVEEEEGEENVEVVGGDGDGDRVLEMKGYSGVGDVLERVWRKVERIGTAVLRKQRTVTANELGNGHDGDL